MFSFVGSFCFIFVFYFHVVKGFVLFVSFVVCVFTACRITSREGTRQRLDGGSRQRFYCRPGVFFFHPSGVFFVLLCSSFLFFGAIICFFALALSPYIFHFISFVCFISHFSFFSCASFVFPFSLFQCIGVAGVCCACHKPSTMAWHYSYTTAAYMVKRSCLSVP